MAPTPDGQFEQAPWKRGPSGCIVYGRERPVTGKPRRLKQTCPRERSGLRRRAGVGNGKVLWTRADSFGRRQPSTTTKPQVGRPLRQYLETRKSGRTSRWFVEPGGARGHEGGYIAAPIGPVLGEVKDPQKARCGTRSTSALQGAERRVLRGSMPGAFFFVFSRVPSTHAVRKARL